MDNLLELQHIYFAYPDTGEKALPSRNLLNDVSLTVMPGQHIGLYGPNGSGKTTLFRLIVGLEKIRSGRLLFHNKPVLDEKDFHALRLKVGLVLQHAEDQLFCPTVLEDVAFGPLNMGMAPREARERALSTLRELGLEGFETRLTHRLSGGEQRLVALATVLAMRPDLLLLDEPSSELDPLALKRLTDILQNLPTARIVISHDWDFLAAISEKFVTIENGTLSESLTPFPHSHIHVHPLGDRPHAHQT